MALIRFRISVARMMFLEGKEIITIPCKLDPADERNKEYIRIISLKSLDVLRIDESKAVEAFNESAWERSRLTSSKRGTEMAFYYYEDTQAVVEAGGVGIIERRQELIRLSQELGGFIDQSSLGVKERPPIGKLLKRLRQFTANLQKQGLIIDESRKRTYRDKRFKQARVEEEYKQRELESQKAAARKPVEELNLLRINLTRAREAFSLGLVVWILPSKMNPQEIKAKLFFDPFINGFPDPESSTHRSRYDRLDEIANEYFKRKCSPPSIPSFYIEDREEDRARELEIINRAIELREVIDASPVGVKEAEGFNGLFGHLRSIPSNKEVTENFEAV